VMAAAVYRKMVPAATAMSLKGASAGFTV
jgi:hypothetical protein